MDDRRSLFQEREDWPDVEFYLASVLDRPTWVVMQRTDSFWAEMCELFDPPQLTYRFATEMPQVETTFVIFEPPHITQPILSILPGAHTEKFEELVTESKGEWGLALQWTNREREKRSKFFIINAEDRVLHVRFGEKGNSQVQKKGWFVDTKTPVVTLPGQKEAEG